MPEQWRPIPGWPGYEVSDHHRVRSVDRVLSDGRRAGGVLLRQRRDRRGRDGKGAIVRLSDGGRSRTVRVYVLVAEAFLGPRPDGMVILHKEDDHSRDDLEALRYGTEKQNVRERIRRERRKRGKGKKRETGEIGTGADRVLTIAPLVAPGQDGGR